MIAHGSRWNPQEKMYRVKGEEDLLWNLCKCQHLKGEAKKKRTQHYRGKIFIEVRRTRNKSF